MALKKLPNSLTNKELLDSIKDVSNDEPVILETHSNDVLKFLTTYNIKPGKQLVMKRLLYDLYRKWSKMPVDPRKFTFEVGKYLLLHGTRRPCYFINREGFTLAQEIEKLYIQHTKDKTKIVNYKRHFDSFLNYYGLKPGNYYIESYVLYNLYDKWVYKNGNQRHPLGSNQFHSFCKLYFKKERLTSNRVAWFGVNKKAIQQHLSQDEIEYIRQGRQLYASKKQTKSTKK